MERKNIVWDAEKCNRLYDYFADNPAEESSYFGYQVGKAIVEFCGYFANIKECKVLDYGSGMGHLLSEFIDYGVDIWGCDMSSHEVAYCNEKFENKEKFHGVYLFDGHRLPFETESFDFITCTECIEHILPEHMGVLDELYRVLKAEGRILITTPNEEDFKKAEFCCPECNTVFHRYGHVNRFSAEELKKLMESHDYKTIQCQGTDFVYFQKFIWHKSYSDMSIKEIKEQIKKECIKMVDFKRGTMGSKVFNMIMHLNRTPNLFYVGEK